MLNFFKKKGVKKMFEKLTKEKMILKVDPETLPIRQYTDEVILHISDSVPELTTPEEIENWHIERGLRTIGYHACIDQDGKITLGVPIECKGQHCSGRNYRSIGIVFFLKRGDFANEKQVLALEDFLDVLLDEYEIKMIAQHCQFDLHKDYCRPLSDDDMVRIKSAYEIKPKDLT